MSEKCKHSRCWVGDEKFPIDLNDEVDLLRLSSLRRAIANFVYILTGKNIPVKFADGKGSKTDGTVVYIGGQLAEGEVDAVVGLALHEAMHIVKSDFVLIKNLWGKVPRYVYDAADGKMTKKEVAGLVKLMLNIVEDRYIDACAYSMIPGYRGYYDALYEKYFLNDRVDKILVSNKLREPTIRSYKFRILGLVNRKSDLDALPGLREIHDLIDIDNILRLTTASDRLDIASEVTKILLENAMEKHDEKEPGEEDGTTESDEDDEDDEDSGDDDETNADVTDAEIDEILEERESETNGEVEATAYSDETLGKLDDLMRSESEVKTVGGECGIPRIQCIVIKKMTAELMESEIFPYKCLIKGVGFSYDDAVISGVVYGTMLGNKLVVRNESRTTKFTRQNHGKFDHHVISDLGYGSEDVFYRTTVESYKRAHIHISVDASSSMAKPWERTMKLIVAVAKAGAMVNNLDIVISFRSGVNRNDVERPCIVIAYDSRVDKFNKVKDLFPKIVPKGTTPEGLTFEAIMDFIPPSTDELDSYFLNISDGAPSFGRFYQGKKAANHTQKQIEKMRSVGVNVLSYFIGKPPPHDNPSDQLLFRTMYGQDARFIDVENIVQISKTLNEMLVRKC